MSTTYDPRHPLYLDEADVRSELARVNDVCSGCRRCIDLCGVFPTLFDLIERFDDRDAARLTPAEQDHVVDRCFQCKLCSIDCPYSPAVHDLAVDVPRLMLRVGAMRVRSRHTTIRRRTTDGLMARTDLLGAIASPVAPIVNTVIGAPPGSLLRRTTAAVTGISAVRLLPPFARQRFSTWFRRRTGAVAGDRRGTVTVLPTCFVEYHETGIGKDLVRVLERNGIECVLSDAGCCGAPWLHAGDVARFAQVAARNVVTLAREVGAHGPVVVPEPTCSYVLKHDYREHVGGPEAEVVAGNTYGAAEYLMRIHGEGGPGLDTDFGGAVPDEVTYHLACHLRAQSGHVAGRRLLELTGATVTSITGCSGTGGMWGLRAENEREAISIARDLAVRIEETGTRAIAGDCSRANRAIAEQVGFPPMHPVSVLARAYGIDDS
jgi:Fe-S oxidoreductase